MAIPNYKNPIGGLVTNRYDFQSHITGTSFRHNSNQIDVSPPVDVNGMFYHNVADALAAVSSLTSAANTLIFKPHGVANSNVYTSWTALFAARDNIQGPAKIVIDSLANTTISIASNGAVLPQSTINVVSTAGFSISGSIFVVSDSGLSTVAYSGITSTSFIGCSGGSGTISTGALVYQNDFATIDLGVWDLKGNTSIVGNLFSFSLFASYGSVLNIPDGARLLNPVLFSNITIITASNNPLGAIDISPPFSSYAVEFDKIFIINSGSGPSMNVQTGVININNHSLISSSIIGGSFSGILTIDLNDGSKITPNAINISSGTVNVYVNGSSANCFTPQTGTVNIIGLVGDVNGQPNSNIITNISGDGINNVNINTSILQWSASPIGGAPVGLTQIQASSGGGDLMSLTSQAAATGSNANGGSVLIVGGAADGSGTTGGVTLSSGVATADVQGLAGAVILYSSARPATGVSFQVGGTEFLNLVKEGPTTEITMAAASGGLSIEATRAASGAGQNINIIAQAAATGSNANGGNLDLLSGIGDGSGHSGSIAILTGDLQNVITISSTTKSIIFNTNCT